MAEENDKLAPEGAADTPQAQPAQPTAEPVQPAQPVQPAAEPAQPTQPAAEPAQPVQPVQPAVAPQPAADPAAAPVQPAVDPAQPANPYAQTYAQPAVAPQPQPGYVQPVAPGAAPKSKKGLFIGIGVVVVVLLLALVGMFACSGANSKPLTFTQDEFLTTFESNLNYAGEKTLTVQNESDADIFFYSLYDGSKLAGGGGLMVDDETVKAGHKLKGAEQYSVVILVDKNMRNSMDYTANALVALIKTCDPGLSLDEVKDIAMQVVDAESLTRNGVTYGLSVSGDNVALTAEPAPEK